MKNIKSEKGSLALFVTIAMLFFMAFLLALFLSTANEQKTQLAVTARIKETYEQDLDNVNEIYNSFVGTEEYIPIYTAEQLKKVGTGKNVYISEVGKYYTFNLDSKYILKNNIELNPNKYTVADDGTITFTSDAEQWVPIGTSASYFTGTFDGNGYKISGLYINNTSLSNQGLFGYNNGTIQNIIVDNGYINAHSYLGGITAQNLGDGIINNCINNIEITINNFGNSGGVCGLNYNLIKNCTNNKKVSSTASTWNVGGICGNTLSSNAKIINCVNKGEINTAGGQNGGIVGTIKNGTLIEMCYNEGKVVSVGTCAGGIVSYIFNSGTTVVKNCYNVGKIEGNQYVAGIIGQSNNVTLYIENCYNIGDITGDKCVGSIGGSLYNTDKIIKSCYNIGNINGNSSVGGIIGWNNLTSDISNCYYLTGTATGGINGADVEGQAEVKTALFMQSSNFVDLLGNTNWKLVNNKNSNYPVLSWENGTAITNYTYAQEGLILWYDAIDNLGTGTHSETSTTWKDLSLTGNDGTLNNFDTNSWKKDSLSFDGTNTWILTPITELTDSYTYEIVLKIPSIASKSEEYIFNFSPIGGFYQGIRLQNNGKMNIQSFSDYSVNTISYEDYVGKRCLFTTSATKNSSSTFCVNGNSILTFTSGNLSYSQTGNLVIGDLRPNRNIRFTGEICSFRVYNRSLNNEEIQKNYQIDKTRFGI